MIRFYVTPKKICIAFLVVIACIDGSYIHKEHKYKRLCPPVEREITAYKAKNRKQYYKDRHPKIRKTVPTAFKDMMSDGKQVENAENWLIQYAGKHHTTRLNDDNPQIKSHTNVLHQFISGNVTDGDLYNNPWTNYKDDKVILLPGASDADGTCECAFEIENTKTHSVDNLFSCQYTASDHSFSNIDVHNTDAVFGGKIKAHKGDAKKSKKSTKRKSRQKNQKNKKAGKKNNARGRRK